MNKEKKREKTSDEKGKRLNEINTDGESERNENVKGTENEQKYYKWFVSPMRYKNFRRAKAILIPCGIKLWSKIRAFTKIFRNMKYAHKTYNLIIRVHWTSS